MKLKNGYTPRTAALDIATGWLRAAFEGKTADVADYATTPAQERALRLAIGKLHNRLLDSSGLDGSHLGDVSH